MKVRVGKTILKYVELVITLMILTLISGVFMVVDVFANPGSGGGAAEGGAGAEGGKSCAGLNWLVCTSYGARWEWHQADSDYIVVPGLGNSPFARTTVIRGCKTFGGGYWQYGMVAGRDGKGFSKGQQVGVASIGGAYASSEFGGMMNDLNPESWRQAQEAYANWQAMFPDSLQKGFNRNSDLGWFCASPNPTQMAPQEDPCSLIKPEDIESGVSHVITSVNNKNLGGTYAGWRENKVDNGLGQTLYNTTYAMPTDDIDWMMCYWPAAEQNKHKRVVEINGINVVDHKPDSAIHGQCPWDQGFKQLKDSEVPKWPESFRFKAETDAGEIMDSEGSKSIDLEGVDYVENKQITDQYHVSPMDVGKRFHDAMWTEGEGENEPSKVARILSTETHSWHCSTSADPYDPGYNEKHEWITGEFKRGVSESSAFVEVPYNFTTSTEVKLENENTKLDSGTWFKIESSKSYIKTKLNFVTERAYATKAETVTVKLFAYVADTNNTINVLDQQGGGITCGNWMKQCDELETESYSGNSSGNLYGEEHTLGWSGATYAAYDAPAGQHLCVVTAMTPVSSGDDMNLDPSGFDHSWFISAPSCRLIVKKPTFQVWGGDMYSAKDVYSITTDKSNIYRKGYKKNGNTNEHFSSWVEHGLMIKDGSTTTVSSGAADAFHKIDENGIINAGVSGGDTGICKLSPLSFANKSCDNAKGVGNFKLGNLVSGIDREDLVKYWLGMERDDNIERTTYSENLDLQDSSASYYGVIESPITKIRYTYVDGDVKLRGDVPRGTTYLIKTDGTVTIEGDIRYYSQTEKDKDPVYTQKSDIPKVIIYAKSVKISCKVNRVDAIIITAHGGEVDTCYNRDNGETSENQLRIFGIVYTDKILLKRTYGAAAWDGKRQIKSADGTLKKVTSDGLAAEVFDYDATIPMWSEHMSGSAETDTLQVMYQHELAPRY